jgi:hypothetical protein
MLELKEKYSAEPVLWIRIQIQEGKNEKKKTLNKFPLLKCWLFSFES